MNEEDRQLSSVLHALVPDPPETLSASGLADNAIGADRDRGVRRFVRLAPLLAAVCVLAIAIGVAIASSRGRTPQAPGTAEPSELSGSPSAASTSPSGASTAPSASLPVPPPGAESSPVTQSSPAVASTCTVGNLRGVVAHEASAMNQMYVLISVTNQGPGSCSIDGYPEIKRAVGGPTGGAAQSATLDVKQSPGGTFTSDDPGPHVVSLAAGEAASFTVMASEGNGGGVPRLSIQQIAIGVPGSTGTLTVDMPAPNGLIATAPPGQAIPLSVGAFARST
jgi:hypothetical protein